MKYFSLNTKAFSFAFRIMLGCAIAWWTLYAMNDKSKIWALISVIIVSDPDFTIVRTNTVSRVVNTTMGCILGLLCLYLMGVNVWSLMVGIIISVLVGTSFKNYPTSWKLGPTTVVIIIAPSIFAEANLHDAMMIAFTRTAEVLYGSLIALSLGFAYFKLHQLMEKMEAKKTKVPKP
jgi:uncharacterized membrane protein YccC